MFQEIDCKLCRVVYKNQNVPELLSATDEGFQTGVLFLNHRHRSPKSDIVNSLDQGAIQMLRV